MVSKKLTNNLTFIAHKNDKALSVTIACFFRVGPHYETPKTLGITHLVEHLFFHRLDQYPQKELYSKLNRIGAVLNGSTYRGCVRFDLTVQARFIQEAVQIAAMLFSDFSWSAEEVEQAKRIVLNQISLSHFSYEEYMERLTFPTALYRRRIMGTPECVSSFSAEDVNKHKKKYFTCDNALLVVSGCFSNESLSYMENTFESIQNRGHCLAQKTELPKNAYCRNDKSIIIDSHDSAVADVSVSFDLEYRKTHPGTLLILRSIIGGGYGTRMQNILTEQYALTDAVEAALCFFDTYSKLRIEYRVNNKDLLLSLRLLFQGLQEIRDTVSEDDIAENILFYTDNYERNLLDTRFAALEIGWEQFYFQRLYDFSKIIDHNKKITVAELQDLAKNLLRKENLSLYVSVNLDVVRKKDIQLLYKELRQSL